MRFEFVEATSFTRNRAEYLDEEALRQLQNALSANYAMGDVMPRCGGLRKIRWPDARRGKGTRGGLRIIYFCSEFEKQIWLIVVYDKDGQDNLTRQQERVLKQMVEDELERRAHRRRQL